VEEYPLALRALPLKGEILQTKEKIDYESEIY
jgi:hypothetical protein